MKITDDKIRNAEGRVIIDMQVRDDTTFLSTFSNKDAQVISSDVAEFIENSVKTVKPKEKLNLRVYSDCIDENEKKLYTKGIYKYYADSLISVEREHRINLFIALILGLIGLALLAVSIIIGDFGSEIWMEAIDIVAWVFCWEAVDVAVFRNRNLRIKRLRYTALSTMTIEFYKLNNDKKGE